MLKSKILIVEDEKDTLFLLDKLLSMNNYEVLSASNGEEALDVLKTVIPQVIIADWTMPVMSGFELCNIIKNDEKFKLIYFIILTGRASLKDRVMGLDIGADDFVVKPVENQELLARIKAGVRIHNLQNELKSIEHSKAILEMACTIGHKINNPLSSLSVTLKNLQEEVKALKIDNFNDDFLIINQSVERIANLVKDLQKLDNPKLINYTPETKMLKLD